RGLHVSLNGTSNFLVALEQLTFLGLPLPSGLFGFTLDLLLAPLHALTDLHTAHHCGAQHTGEAVSDLGFVFVHVDTHGAHPSLSLAAFILSTLMLRC